MGFWNLSNIGSIVSIISFIPICYAGWTYISVKRIQKRNLEIIRNFEPRVKSAILIIDFGEDDVSMRTTVESWIKKQDDFREHSKDNIHHIMCIKRISENDIDALLKKIKDCRTKIMASGAVKIHLFYRGPVVLASIIGALFSNGCPIIFYQKDIKNEDGNYINWGPIER